MSGVASFLSFPVVCSYCEGELFFFLLRLASELRDERNEEEFLSLLSARQQQLQQQSRSQNEQLRPILTPNLAFPTIEDDDDQMNVCSHQIQLMGRLHKKSKIK